MRQPHLQCCTDGSISVVDVEVAIIAARYKLVPVNDTMQMGKGGEDTDVAKAKVNNCLPVVAHGNFKFVENAIILIQFNQFALKIGVYRDCFHGLLCHFLVTQQSAEMLTTVCLCDF